MIRWLTCVAAVTVALAHGSVSAQPARPKIGVAFGGGSARGIAHIGVIAWFEENHIPIDMAAGTSMGGLVGGTYATGMNAAELRDLIANTDWDTLFGSSSFRFKNVRRKEDARSYPSRLEFGMKGGIVPPTSLNDGQQVDLLLARIAGPYYAIESFDELPTPFRTVAVDLRSAERVVLSKGSFADAMRSTMSLPGVFPPVSIGEYVLVDGGALDNIPADVVKEMGATVVVAVDVGYPRSDNVDYSLFGLLGQTIDTMMRANTLRAIAAADITIGVDVQGFGSLDWRRADELIARGREAAERHRNQLMPYALNDADWNAWVAARDARRRRTLPQPTFLSMSGIAPADVTLVRKQLARHVDTPINVEELQEDLAELSGLDRYQGITWQVMGPPGREGVMVRAREKAYAPPFLMLGLNLENTTSDDFRVQFAARYLAFDVLTSGSEMRLDASIGSDPSAAAAMHIPLRRSRVFVRPYAGALQRTFNVVQDSFVVAEYRERRMAFGGDAGVTLGRDSEVAAGFRLGRMSATIVAGDPGLPEMEGLEGSFRAFWIVDKQDSPVLPSTGVRAAVTLTHLFESPNIEGFARTNDGLTQMEGGGSSFWSLDPRKRNRFFVVVAGGTSFDGEPLPTAQFTVGYPFRLDAFTVGERRGDHYLVGTAGFARQIARLPDFLGGPIFAGVWSGTGALYTKGADADINTHIGVGLIADTLVGGVVIGTSVGVEGDWRAFVGVGRVFR
jgi:NTE family protein